ncbi:MAG: hypothetical protein DFNUSKGM_001017 [Candidatus Fervidibacter sacchari]|mgnify:CR=1 FL=1
MPWAEVISELESKLVDTLKGTFTPMDGVPFFRVMYPPREEREALRQFNLLADRLNQQGWQTVQISLTEAMKEALASLLGCGVDKLAERLKEEERRRDQNELKSNLAEHLPPEMAKMVIAHIDSHGLSKKGVAFLVRTGTIYPFMRPSHLLARLEGKVKCAIVIAYPGTSVGAFLDSEHASLYGGYYRGEIIQWR